MPSPPTSPPCAIATGFASPIGRRCSNLLEQIAALPTYERPEWAKHEWQTAPYMIKQQIAGLARLTGGMQ